MQFRISDGMAHQFLADNLVNERPSGAMIREHKPANRNHEKETDPRKLISFKRQWLARFSLPKCRQEASRSEHDPERSFGERRECGHQPEPGPTLTASPRPKPKQGG